MTYRDYLKQLSRFRPATRGDVAELRDSINKLGDRIIMAISQETRDVINRFNSATNTLAARIKSLEDKITDAGMSAADEAAALEELKAVASQLETLGADPANPIPVP